MFANAFGSHERVECGLCTIIKRDEWTQEIHPIPLQSVDVKASVVHAVSQVEVTQVFVNKEEQPIEAIYYFPIDSNGAVTHFEAEIEGRKIKGIAKAHEEAKEEYEKAIENHQTAFLGEENKADIFKVRIGFLKPGNTAKIVLGYVSEVKNEKGSSAIRFFIPTTVAPRYVPQRLDDEKSEDLKKMQFAETSPAPMSIKVNVSIQGGIKSVESPTHKITITNQGRVPEKSNWTIAEVELSGKTTDMDRDFVLLVTPTETHKPRLYLEKVDTSLAVMAHLIPSFKLDEQNAELIFVLDRSGSMQGQSIELAKKALTLFLHSLPADCYFNIVGFGSSYKLLFPKSVKYDDGSLKTAVAHAKELDADMGGTEILEPLKEIFASETIPGYLRQIFVITDGEVGNTDEVIGITKAKAHESRVFALGIGDGASHHLVEGIAQAGGGTSAFVTYNEGVDKKVLQQLKDALQPSLTNVRIIWEGITPLSNETPSTVPINKEKTLMGYGKPVEAVDSETVEKTSSTTTDASPVKKSYHQAPEKIPPIFDGSQLVVFGVFENPAEKPTGAIITADSPDGPLSLQLEISDDNDVGETGMIHKLAAIKIVREIEMKVAALGFDRWDPEGDAERKKKEAIHKAEIIEIAVKEGIASKYTSFVAVDTAVDKKTPDNWAMQTRLVPSQLAHGWHGMGRGGIANYRSRSAYSVQSQSRSAMLFSAPNFGCAPKMRKAKALKSSASVGSPTLFGSSRSGGGSFGSSASFGATMPSFGRLSPMMAMYPSYTPYTPTNPSNAPKSPSYSPVSPSCSPVNPMLRFSDRGRDDVAFGSSASFGAPMAMACCAQPMMVMCDALGAPRSGDVCKLQSVNICENDTMEMDDTEDFYSVPTTEADAAEVEESQKEALPAKDVLHEIVSFQSFDGSFKLEDSLIKSLGLDIVAVKQDAEKNGWDLNAWATALAVTFFSEKLADRKDSWELVVSKALKWLKKNHSAFLDAMLALAKSSLESLISTK